MHNLALAVILAEQRHRQCPCGAVADRPYGLCRKCQNRNAWRRKTAVTRRCKASRRRGIARRVRGVVRFLADVLFLVPTLTAGREC